LLLQDHTFPNTVLATKSTAQAILTTLFGPEYMSADRRQVLERAVFHLHALLHAHLKAATPAATPRMVPQVEQVDARIVQVQEQAASLGIQKRNTENALEKAENMCASI
jgi:hypothetical protein